MIDLTPLEVRKKKGDFRRGMRGYDPQSVDDFLDVVADRLEQLVRENASMHERFSRLEDQVNDYRERERALTEALVTAQEMREQMRLQLEREAELKRREAEADAENIRSEARQTLEREEETIRRLQARQAQFLQSYRAFLERELAELSAEMESLDLGRAGAPTATGRPRKRPAPEAQAAAAEPAPQTQQPQQTQKPQPPQQPQPRKVEPEPLPLLEPEDIAPPAAAAGLAAAATVTNHAADDFERDAPFFPEPDAEPELTGGSAPRDKTFDELLNALPGFAGAAEPKQVASTQPPAQRTAASADEEAELLADVRAEFDAVAADDVMLPPPEPMPAGDDMLELVDDVADDEDEGGWMSTLLEGRGDDRSN